MQPARPCTVPGASRPFRATLDPQRPTVIELMHSRQIPSATVPSAVPPRGRQRHRSDTASSASSGYLSASVSASASGQSSPYSPGISGGAASPVHVFDAMEREQEAIVNKLQREIITLREGGIRSRSRSASSAASTRSTSSTRAPPAGAPSSVERRSRVSVGEHDTLLALRRENELLRRKVASLTAQLAERDHELERARRVGSPAPSSVQSVASQLNASHLDSSNLSSSSSQLDSSSNLDSGSSLSADKPPARRLSYGKDDA